MSFTKTFYISDAEFEVEFEASRYKPAKTYGPPENCYPAEGGEVEIETVTVGGVEIKDFLSESTMCKLQQMAEEAAPELFDDLDQQNQEDAAELHAFNRHMDC